MSESSSPKQPDGEANKYDPCSLCAKHGSYCLCAQDGGEEDQRPTDDYVEFNAAVQVGEAVASYTVVPPDGGWGWVIVAASFFCNIIVDGIIFAFGMFLGDISRAFDESKAKVSIIGSLLAGFYLMVGPFVSALANRYGFRTVCILGSVLGGIGFVLSCLADSVTYLYFTYGVLGGIGFGLVYVPAVIAVGFYFEKWRALATGIAVCGSGIGTFLMAPLCTVLISTYGWRGALLIQAGLVLNCAVFGTLFRPLKPLKLVAQPDVDVVDNDDQKKSSAEQLPLLYRIKMDRDDDMKKCESVASFADIASVTADPKTGPRSRFLKTSNNNKYPTAAQVLARSTTALSSAQRPSSHSLNAQTNSIHGSNTSNASPPKSQKRLSGSSYTDAVQQEEEGKPVLAVNAVPEDVTLKRVATCNEILMPVEEERRGSDETTEILGEAGRVVIVQAANKAGKRARTTSECSSKSRDVGVRPLYRDDIFFGASLQKLPQYTSLNSVRYHMSVTRLPSKKDVMEEVNQECRLCPEAVGRTVSTMLDMSLLRSPSFLLLAVSGFITMMGFYVPFMYVTDRAELSGMDSSLSVWLVSTIGIANTIGRVVSGLVSSLLPNVDALLINNAALTIGGIVTIMSGFSLSFVYQIIYCSVFGLSMASFASLRSILIVDLMGLDKLTNAFGLLLLFQGVAAAIGSPVAGLFMDATGSYDASFYLSGSLILVSAILCYPLKRLNAWEMEKSRSRAQSNIE